MGCCCCCGSVGFEVRGRTGSPFPTGTRFWCSAAVGLLTVDPVLKPVCLRGGGGGGAASDWVGLESSLIGFLPTLAGRVDGSKGGGSFLGVVLDAEDERRAETLTCSNGEVDMLEKDDKRDSDLGTLTQSGSSVGAYGLVGRFGLRIVIYAGLSGLGGLMCERAIFPFSSHHFWRSELDGGRPGSIASYPIKSSSSNSSVARFAVSPPTSTLRRS